MKSVIAANAGNGDHRKMAGDKHTFFHLSPRHNATAGKGTLSYVMDEMQSGMAGVPQQRANCRDLDAYLRLVPGGSQLPGQLP
ncbi:MAG: hypothetical protein GZ085_00255 [Sulfuriferula multivorans]|uniref:Uncharacterized protein n=1 Tax=Sulfuriferula multivorans TaxID=1559896 RepID=A0A7C9NYH5_9PROT|nr:hypothetical protein [Sulfuriferula multivorans]